MDALLGRTRNRYEIPAQGDGPLEGGRFQNWQRSTTNSLAYYANSVELYLMSVAIKGGFIPPTTIHLGSLLVHFFL